MAISMVLAMALYGMGLSGGFFFDDDANIAQIENLQLEQLSLQNLKAAWQSGRAGPLGRPIAQVSFALNHYFGGFDPFFFKLTNLLIHLVAGILVFFTARRFTPSEGMAGFIAALWLLHPIQVTSVLYVVQRMTSLSAVFLLAAFLLHILGRERGAWVGRVMVLTAWGVCWPLSILSKETGVLFPLFVLAWELILRRSRHDGLDRFARIYAVVTVLLAAACLIYISSPLGRWLWAGYEFRSFTPWERLLTEGRVLWFYMGLIVFPRLEDFSLFHDDVAVSAGLFVPWTTFAAGSGLAILVGVAFWSRNKQPLLAFGLAWFLVGHALESTFLPLEIAHEHRNYLPSFGIVLIAAWGIAQLAQRPGWRKTLGMVSGAVVLAHSAFVTGLRAHQFGDDVRRTQIEAQHHPHSARTHYEAGRVLMQRAMMSSADDPIRFFVRSHYEQAAVLDPNAKLPWLGLIHMNCSANQPVDKQWLDELARRLRETPFAPGDKAILGSVKEMSIAGTLCLDRGEVEALFSAAVANPTLHAHVRGVLYSWLADYFTLGARDMSAAQIALDKSLAISPRNPGNRLKMAQLNYLQGQSGAASEILDGLPDAELLRSERETKTLLRQCIALGETARCAGL